MSPAPLKPFVWPDCPDGFDANGLMLLLCKLPANTPRPESRRLARNVLSKVAGRLAPNAELVESPNGPELAGSEIRISLSYAAGMALIGLSKFQEFGVDIVRVENLPEIDMLARLYLPKSARHDALPPVESFGLRWAQTEACCKALRLPLAEIDAARERAYAACRLVDCEQFGGYKIAAAVHYPVP